MKSRRKSHPEVTCIETYAATITAQPGQWFVSTGKRWELWDKCEGHEICVRRILNKNVLNIERKVIARRKFMERQNVTLELAKNSEGQERRAYGHVTGVNPDSTIIGVDIPNPPEWMYSNLRRRGIFMSGPVALQLFFDHAGTWTDIYGFNHYRIL